MGSNALRIIKSGRIAKDLRKKEGNTDIRVAIRKIFRTIYKLFQRKKNANLYPNNFYVGQAISNGSCFFDSFRQSLEQQKGKKVTVEQLRIDCFEFAFSAPEWFTRAIANSYDDIGRCRNEDLNSYAKDILNNGRWGDPEVEGRILCKKYDVKLHVVESNPWYKTDKTQDQFLHQLIDNRDSSSVGEYNRIDYGDNDILHIINRGDFHFEPLLSRDKNLTKQPQGQEYRGLKQQISQIESGGVKSQGKKLDRVKPQGEKPYSFRPKQRKGGRAVRTLVEKFMRKSPKYQPINCSIEEVSLTQHRVPPFVQ